MNTIVDHNPALFKAGDPITVALKFPIGHYRVPFYIRGKNGVISKNLGRYINPEEEAFGKNAGNKLWYYAVRFIQKDLWPDYKGPADDILEIEIFENWLVKQTPAV
jgi:nitrile hydratase